MKVRIRLLFITLALTIHAGCTKDFLNVKPDKSLVVPTSLDNFQALLNNRYNLFGQTIYLTHMAEGDFTISEIGLNSLNYISLNSYLWKEDVFENTRSFDWERIYKQIFYANIVLDGISKIDRDGSNAQQVDQIKGSALFMRAYALNQATQMFAPPYNPQETERLLGVPIRIDPDVTIKSKRVPLGRNYESIIQDLLESIPLLPERIENKSRPTVAAAWAMLARVYLIMGEFEKAVDASSLALNIQSELIDYNDLDVESKIPFPDGRKKYNEEIIYYTDQAPTSFYDLNSIAVSSDLYNEYDSNDLRKLIYFTSTGSFKGSYGGSPYFIFTGLATDELYLIRSESNARMGNIKEAMRDLNTLMVKRMKNMAGDTINLLTAENEIEALVIILQERRKELVARGLRWSDLRRLNLDSRFETTLNRTYMGVKYQLLPNDKRYTFPIPNNEIDANGMEQNFR